MRDAGARGRRGWLSLCARGRTDERQALFAAPGDETGEEPLTAGSISLTSRSPRRTDSRAMYSAATVRLDGDSQRGIVAVELAPGVDAALEHEHLRRGQAARVEGIFEAARPSAWISTLRHALRCRSRSATARRAAEEGHALVRLDTLHELIEVERDALGVPVNRAVDGRVLVVGAANIDQQQARVTAADRLGGLLRRERRTGSCRRGEGQIVRGERAVAVRIGERSIISGLDRENVERG